MASQDLTLDPAQPLAGRETTVTFRPPDAKAGAGAELKVVWKDGTERVLGKTDAEGRLVWTPERTGEGSLQASVGDVQHVAHVVVAAPHSVLGWIVPWTIAALLVLLLTRWANRHQRLREARAAEGAETGH